MYQSLLAEWAESSWMWVSWVFTINSREKVSTGYTLKNTALVKGRQVKGKMRVEYM